MTYNKQQYSTKSYYSKNESNFAKSQLEHNNMLSALTYFNRRRERLKGKRSMDFFLDVHRILMKFWNAGRQLSENNR